MSQELIEGFRLSLQQQRLWVAQQNGRAFKAQCAVELKGRLDVRALGEALVQVIDRHEALRTAFHSLEGMALPLQVVAERAELSLREVDCRDLPPAARASRLEQVFREELDAPLDLGRGPLARFTLLTCSAEQHFLLVSLPAMCADALTLKNLIEEWGALYGARLADEAPLEESLQYVQFSEWQHELLDEEDGEAGREFWVAQKVSARQNPSLPFESWPSVTADRASGGPGSAAVTIDPGQAAALGALAERYGVSVSVCLLACWKALLGRLTGEPEVVVRALFEGRKFKELQGAMGPFASHLPVASRVGENLRFDELLAHVARRVDEINSWQEYFREEPGAAGDGTDPEPPVGFEFEEWPAEFAAGDVRVSLVKRFVWAEEFKLKLSALLVGGSLTAEFYYDPAVYQAPLVEHLKHVFAAFLANVLSNPEAPLGSVELLGEAEKRLLLEEWNETRAEYRRDAPGHRLFEEQAERTPNATAVVFGRQQLSFAELNRRANQLAHYLRRLGVGPESPVALLLERSAETVVGLLAVMKAGGFYVPLDPGQPKKRLRFMLEDARPAAVVSQRSVAAGLDLGEARIVLVDSDAELIARESEENPAPNVSPENLAYVIYTSGSTGQPKGTMIAHRSVVNLATALRRSIYARYTPPLKVSLNAPLAFDASVKQLVQLLDGHSLHLVPEEARRDGTELLAFIQSQGLDVFDCTPSHLKVLLAAGLDGGPTPGVILVGGEAWDESDWATLAENTATEFYNVYGPTECTVNASVCALREAPGRPTIGRPIANVRLYILDAGLRPVPVGVPGELFIGGAGVARGYLNRPALTAEKFLPDPFGGEPGARLYRSGDRARYLPDGNVEFLGRLDDQVKVRGFRIELGEIEAVIRQLPAVRDAVVLARADESGDRRLVAYVVPADGRASAPEAADGYRLPNGMVIAHQNKNETDYLYEEIFEKETYVQHGIELADGCCVFDVGANIGMFTLFVGARCKNARVYAFEPLAPIYEKLKVNAELSGAQVETFNFGLSDAEREETFTFYPRYSMMSGTSAYASAADEVDVIKRFLSNEQQAGAAEVTSLLEHADELLEGRFAGETHACQLRTLSSAIGESGVERIDLLKVDVQRAELDVLRGLAEQDWRKIRQIVMEVHDAPGRQSEGRIAEITGLLRRHGFEVVVEQDVLLKGTDRYNLYAVHPDRKGAAGDGRRPEEGERYLVQFQQPASVVKELRPHLEASLPEYMVPSAFVVLPELPLNRNGKVDRAALPDPSGAGDDRDYVPPQTPAEKALAEIWCEVLGLERVGIHDSFFHLGGDSIRSIKLRVLAKKRGLDISLQDIFQHQTIHGLTRLGAAPEAGAEAGQPGRPFGLISEEERRLLPKGAEDAYPLSQLQLGMLFHSEYHPGSAMYYNANTLHLKARFDAESMREAIRQVMARHPALRTSFDLTHFSRPLQIVHADVGVPLTVEDLRGLSPAAQEEFVGRLVESERRTRFNWTSPPLVRFKVHRRSDETFQFTWCEHHSILDGWSLANLTAELFQRYFALLEDPDSRPAPPPVVSYRDFVALEQQSLNSEEDRDYWRDKLGGSTTTPLPEWAARPQSDLPQTRLHLVHVPAEVSDGLKRLTQTAGVTIKSALLAAHLKVMGLLGGRDDVVTGLVSNGRPEELDADQVLGLFLNTLPLRLRLPGGSWLDLLRATFEAERESLPHRRYPLARLQNEFGGAPLFETMFNFTHFHVLHDLRELPQAQLLEWESAVVDINLTLTANFELDPITSDVKLHFQYDANRISAEKMRAVGGYYVAALTAMSADPHGRHDAAPLLAEDERRLLLGFNDTARPFPLDDCLHRHVERQAARTPGAMALVFRDEVLTYEQLNRRANQLAHLLVGRGVGPESLVALYFPRSTEMVVSMLAALKAGAAYLPLDTAYPPQRLAFMLEDARAAILLAPASLRGELPQSPVEVFHPDDGGEELSRQPAENPKAKAGADNLAYVIYTSGSTGVPKAAMNTHRAICNRLLWMQEALGLGPADVVLQKTPYSFDVSVWEFFWPLMVGAKLVLAEPGGHQDPSYLKRLIARQQVTTLHFVPSMMEVFLEEAGLREACGSVRRVVSSGEALSPSLARRFGERMPEGARLYNLYGPTEAAVDVSWWECPREVAAGAVPIGRPIANLKLYVLDEGLRQVLPGVRGELYIAGVGVGRGYLARPGLTAERFVPDPYAGEEGARMYRTGDEVWQDDEGVLHFVGRKDGQIKLRGQRIELGEIEAALSEHGRVKQCAVVMGGAGDGGREQRLVCYVVKRGDVSSAELREHLSKVLPEYMVPAVYVELEEMPLTGSGKVDRKALPAADAVAPERAAEYVAPQTEVEEVVAEIWSQVLGAERVGIDDNFFESGGHSLLATQLIALVNDRFQVELPLRASFDNPTVREMSLLVERLMIEQVLQQPSAGSRVEMHEGL